MTRFESSRSAAVVFAVFLAILFGVEASCLLPGGGMLRALAARAWIACTALILVSVLIHAVLPFFRRSFWSSPDLCWYLAAFFVPVALVLFDVNGYAYTQINDEGLQQVTSGLGLMSGRKDLGLFSVGFLGYPTRQYLLAAMPSRIFGKGLVTLRLGFGGFYLLGYLSFLSCALRYLESRKAWRPMLLASLAGELVALGSYPLLFARLFEQTIVPLSVTLLFLSGLLLFLARPRPFSGLWFIWALGIMPYSYTPSLAAWVLGMAVLAYLAHSGPKGMRAPLVVGLAYGAVTLAVALAVQVRGNLLPSRLLAAGLAGDHASGLSGGGPAAWASRFLNGLHSTFGIEESLVPAPLALGILFILVHSLRRSDYRVLALCLWAAVAVVLSLALKGYWQRVPEFDIQRAMVILPPLSLALVLYVAAHWGALLDGKNEAALRGLILSAVVFMLLNAAYLPLIRRVPRAYFPFEATDREEAAMFFVRGAAPGARVVYVAPPLSIRLEETLAYLSPGTRVVSAAPPEGEHVKGSYVISYAGQDPFVSEDPNVRLADHPVRFLHPRPYLRISPE